MKSTRSHRQGISLIYTMFMLCVLSGFASLAVDWGRVQMVKTQLMRASESAARYGAVGLENGADAALALQKRSLRSFFLVRSTGPCYFKASAESVPYKSSRLQFPTSAVEMAAGD